MIVETIDALNESLKAGVLTSEAKNGWPILADLIQTAPTLISRQIPKGSLEQIQFNTLVDVVKKHPVLRDINQISSQMSSISNGLKIRIAKAYQNYLENENYGMMRGEMGLNRKANSSFISIGRQLSQRKRKAMYRSAKLVQAASAAIVRFTPTRGGFGRLEIFVFDKDADRLMMAAGSMEDVYEGRTMPISQLSQIGLGGKNPMRVLTMKIRIEDKAALVAALGSTSFTVVEVPAV